MKKKTPILLSDNELEDLRQIIEQYRPRLGVLEKTFFFPELIGRLEHTLSLCQKMKTTCGDPNIAHQMGLIFEKLVQEGHIQQMPNAQNEAVKYFQSISTQLERDFIKPTTALIAEFKANQENISAETIGALANKTRNLFQIFIGLRDQLFRYGLGNFFSAKRNDGVIIVAPPVEMDIVALPFKLTIDELANVAEKTNESIKIWIEDLRTNRSRYLDFVIQAAETNRAKTELAAAKKNFWVQVLIAFTALLLIALGYFGNLLLEKRALEKSLEQLEKKNEQCEAKVINAASAHKKP